MNGLPFLHCGDSQPSGFHHATVYDEPVTLAEN